MKTLFLCLALLVAPAGAVELPALKSLPDLSGNELDPATAVATRPYLMITKNGGCVWWWYKVEAAWRIRTYCGTVEELARAGSKIGTVIKSADPLKSLDTLPQRSTVLDLCTDPLFEALRADLVRTRGWACDAN